MQQTTQQQSVISNEQIKNAFQCGSELLNDPDLKVPAKMAINGQMALFSMMVNALASGQFIVTQNSEIPLSNTKEPDKNANKEEKSNANGDDV